ncbi:MAG: FAD-binding protein [Lachnospiraceae bacterium]|nr:FAD-binding protein [Lachnospiraceae bacterium]
MKKLQADVVVVAAGASGLAASVSAAEQGLKVITLEKNKVTGGAASMGMGLNGVGSKNQRMHGLNLTADEAFLKHMHYTHWMGNARLTYDYYRKAASTIDWLEDHGVEFIFRGSSLYTPTRMRPFAQPDMTSLTVKPPEGQKVGPRCASAMTKALTESLISLGAELLTETPAKHVIMKDGKVAGVQATGPKGEDIEIECKAVILACGGFGDNPKMINENLGFTWGEDLFSFRIPGNVGDGLRMAWECGAAKTRVMMELMYQIPDNLNHFDLEGAFRQPLLWVNKMGERFVPEDCIGNTATMGNCILNQPGRTCFTIMDSDTLKYYKRRGVDFPGVQGEEVFDHFDEAAAAAKEEGYKYYFEADTIEELCEKTGIKLEGLKETLEQYNADCDLGRDTVFNKDYHFLRPVRKGPFYALQSFIGAYGTLGGVKVDRKFRAIDNDWEPIPGLYSVGTDCCDIYGDTYPFVLPGNTMGFCVNSGRMAGEYVAEYING